MRIVRLGAAFAALTLLASASALAQDGSTYTYDALGRVTSATHKVGTQMWTTTYQYDAADNRVRLINSANRPPSCLAKTSNTLSDTLTINPISRAPACKDDDGDTVTLISIQKAGSSNQLMLEQIQPNNAVKVNFIPSGEIIDLTCVASDGKGATVTFTYQIVHNGPPRRPIGPGG